MPVRRTVGEREALAATFAEDAELYDRVRPGYPDELFADLAAAVDLGPARRVLEVGAGTGQATRGLAARGARIVALEPGRSLLEVARRRLADLPSVELVNATFEAAELGAGSLDAIAAFTSWHWLDPEVRGVKAARALAPGGALVTVATHHVAGGTQAFFDEVQRCYERWDPATPPNLRLTPADEIAPQEDEPPFGAATFNRYEWERTYTTAEYLDLLYSYSGHRRLAAERRAGLLACIAELIDGRFGGRIAKRYMNELRVTRRP
jgi:SAM-dependent methyltransferase